MDIGKMSMSMSQGALKAAVGISLMKMQMNNNENTAEGIKEMMGTVAVNPNLGQVIDVKA